MPNACQQECHRRVQRSGLQLEHCHQSGRICISGAQFNRTLRFVYFLFFRIVLHLHSNRSKVGQKVCQVTPVILVVSDHIYKVSSILRQASPPEADDARPCIGPKGAWRHNRTPHPSACRPLEARCNRHFVYSDRYVVSPPLLVRPDSDCSRNSLDYARLDLPPLPLPRLGHKCSSFQFYEHTYRPDRFQGCGG